MGEPIANLQAMKPISINRKSVVGAAAYRSGERLYDEKKGRSYDYTRKQDIEGAFILAEDHAADHVRDRAWLWNRATGLERQYNGQAAREVLLTIPRGLEAEQRAELVRSFVLDNFVARGMVADVTLHNPPASDFLTNPHAHILLTMRRLNEAGDDFEKKKERQWNRDFTDGGKSVDPTKGGFVNTKGAGDGFVGEHKGGLKFFRQQWENACNEALEEAGSSDRVSLASYKDRGILREPLEKIGFNHRDRHGWRSDIVIQKNEEIRARNDVRDYFEPRSHRKRCIEHARKAALNNRRERSFSYLPSTELEACFLDEQGRTGGYAR